ncbi:COP9 signalosome complex subunit 6 [Cryptococcus deuterogattii R265]|uniref:COP9 signalosome complex subunit 6 n=1 Tax=Cryptococcus deuterogattii (strain R265) TaxID=294750 RepID=A0A095C5L9_CRYD2|nr:COP9 signalosome complex subunit 6 [Cryptococcus deuterogattii R265]KIR35052.1 COP9 signalosome complex subunit 6 [Cryptococcus deuterogattii MMRL2647]KIR70191.1 COP9 signalosome complex subunit 6 [Cryptococcus deuterogattii CA1014]
MPGSSSSPHVMQSGATSGLNINLHPLAILNISDVYTRAQCTSTGSEVSKLMGALLGTESNREVSIVNSFELIYHPSATSNEDVEMNDSGSARSKYVLDTDFLEARKEQYKQVFPTLDVIGWYSIGKEPSSDDVSLHAQFASSIETPIFLLFDPSPASDSQALPLKIYESATVTDTTGETSEEGKFVELEYGIETGEAERIAVDGVAKGGTGEEDTAVAHLTTQRNAIKMMYDRIEILLKYITGVVNKSAKPDYSILRQISSLVATLPTMDASEFREELITEYSDVQISSYLTTLTKQLYALSEYAEKHSLVYGQKEDEFMGGPGMGMRGGRQMNFDIGGGRRRK